MAGWIYEIIPLLPFGSPGIVIFSLLRAKRLQQRCRNALCKKRTRIIIPRRRRSYRRNNDMSDSIIAIDYILPKWRYTPAPGPLISPDRLTEDVQVKRTLSQTIFSP